MLGNGFVLMIGGSSLDLSEFMVIDGTAPNRSLPVYLIQVPLQKNPTSLNPKNKRGKWKSPINVGFEYV